MPTKEQVRPQVHLSPEALSFCRQAGIATDLSLALDTAMKHFSILGSPAVNLIRDPEIITRGLVHVDASQDILDEVRAQLVGMFTESPREELKDSELLQDVTGSPSLLRQALNSLKLNGGVSGGITPGTVPTKVRGTVLYDAVYAASNDMLAKEVDRKALSDLAISEPAAFQAIAEKAKAALAA